MTDQKALMIQRGPSLTDRRDPRPTKAPITDNGAFSDQRRALLLTGGPLRTIRGPYNR